MSTWWGALFIVSIIMFFKTANDKMKEEGKHSQDFKKEEENQRQMIEKINNQNKKAVERIKEQNAVIEKLNNLREERWKFLKEKLRKDIVNNSYLLYLYDAGFKLEFKRYTGGTKLKSEYDTTYKLIKYITKRAIIELSLKDDEYTIDDIITLFSDICFFESINKECFKQQMQLNIGTYNSNEIVKIELLEELEETMYENYINQIYMDGISMNESLFFNVYQDELYKFYVYSCFLLYVQKFSSNVELLKKNEELYTIINNLMKKIDVNYVTDKVYPIYKTDYANDFNIILSKTGFKNLILLTIEAIPLLNRNITDLKVEMIEIKQHIKVIEKINIIDIEKAMEFINLENTYHKLEKMKKRREENLEEESSIEEGLIAYAIIDILEENLDFDTMLEILNSSHEIYQSFYEKYERLQAKKDKERFLKGDFSREEELQKQEIEYLNIETGFEFEEYVAKLYGKLGYKVEVTKKSKDQGADIIAYKNNMKYVIQAKFYSNPVGNKAVQEVVAAIGMYKANKGIVVTNSSFTPSAIELAKANQIELVDANKIEVLKSTILESLT